MSVNQESALVRHEKELPGECLLSRTSHTHDKAVFASHPHPFIFIFSCLQLLQSDLGASEPELMHARMQRVSRAFPLPAGSAVLFAGRDF